LEHFHDVCPRGQLHLRIGPKKNEGFFNLFPLLFLSLPSFYLSLSPQDVSEHGRGEARTHQFTLCLVSHSTLLSPFSSPCPFLSISRGANESVIVCSDSTPVRSDQLRRCKALSTISANRQGFLFLASLLFLPWLSDWLYRRKSFEDWSSRSSCWFVVFHFSFPLAPKN